MMRSRWGRLIITYGVNAAEMIPPIRKWQALKVRLVAQRATGFDAGILKRLAKSSKAVNVQKLVNVWRMCRGLVIPVVAT